VPFFASIAAGLGEAQQARMSPRGSVAVPRHVLERDPQAYALRVSGESMSPQLLDGDIVVVSPQAALSAGCIVAAQIEGEGDVVKQYEKLRNGGIVLRSINADYPSFIAGPGLLLPDEEGGTDYTLQREDGLIACAARIWGRVVLQLRDL
jgi:SOS-response transcriptional repressor LexA